LGKILIRKKTIYNSDLNIIDAEGNSYFVKEFLSTGKVDILNSIKIFAVMVEVSLMFTGEKTHIEFNLFQKRVLDCVLKNKVFWSSLNDGRGLERMIMDTKDYKELILMFR
jgi:hypothetical protein